MTYFILFLFSKFIEFYDNVSVKGIQHNDSIYAYNVK